jgi:hypothetical protein
MVLSRYQVAHYLAMSLLSPEAQAEAGDRTLAVVVEQVAFED